MPEAMTQQAANLGLPGLAIMDCDGIGPKAQEEIILGIPSFALHGSPESHAASFALIAYASAWLTYAKLLVIEGTLQNVDKVIHIRARQIDKGEVVCSLVYSA